MTIELPPAGWYDDPNDPSAQRYWDGKDWTPHRERKSIASSAPPPVQSPPPSHQPPPAQSLPPSYPVTPPSAPQAGLASPQQAVWDQLQPQVSKARGFWSSLPRQRQVLFAAIGLLAVVVIAAALMMVFHSVTGGPSVDKSALKSDIINRMRDESGGSPDSVTCGDLPDAVGKTANCEVKMPEGVGDFEVVATVTKVDGGKVAYDLAPAFTKEQLEQHVQITNSTSLIGFAGPMESVSCESGLQGKTGAEARCKFRRSGANHHLTARVTNVDGLTMMIDYMPDHD